MKSKIAKRLMGYFAAALLLFSAVMGTLFISLFRTQTIESRKNDLEARAVTIAGALSDYFGTGGDSSHGMGRGNGGMGQMMGGYGSYLQFIDDIAMSDVWVVDEDLNLITSGHMMTKNYTYADLPADADKVVSEVFSGATTFSESFSGLFDTPTLTVGTPITVSGQVVGAVLLHAPVEGLDDATAQGVRILGISALAALALAVLLSLFLAYTFTKPVNKMKAAAIKLADGDYTVKTKVTVKDEIGELAAAIDVLSDRLRAAQQESARLEQLRRDFVSNISHELKTPVTVIRGSLEALCDGVVTNEAQVESYHRQMLLESLHLQRLITDLLDLSKLQNPDFVIEMQPLDLPEIIMDAVRSAERLAQDKNIKITQALESSLPVTGDYGRLRQMFMIVLDNAVKFSPAGGLIEVTQKGRTVSVTDHGAGISEALLPHVFDRFYKVKSEDNKQGSGLGLAIAKEIADRHGVTVSVQSKEGEGTTFQFRF